MNNQVKPFRAWLQEMWLQHLDELESYHLPSPAYSLAIYFRTYKYWLRREYRHQIYDAK